MIISVEIRPWQMTSQRQVPLSLSRLHEYVETFPFLLHFYKYQFTRNRSHTLNGSSLLSIAMGDTNCPIEGRLAQIPFTVNGIPKLIEAFRSAPKWAEALRIESKPRYPLCRRPSGFFYFCLDIGFKLFRFMSVRKNEEFALLASGNGFFELISLKASFVRIQRQH